MECLYLEQNTEIPQHFFKARVNVFFLFFFWKNGWKMLKAGVTWNPITSRVCQVT